MKQDQNTNPLPPLDSATHDALRASIEKFGVLVPILLDQHGAVLDGHHAQQPRPIWASSRQPKRLKRPTIRNAERNSSSASTTTDAKR